MRGGVSGWSCLSDASEMVPPSVRPIRQKLDAELAGRARFRAGSNPSRIARGQAV